MPRLITNAVPIGEIKEFSGSVLPNGYLNCDGAAYSRTTYADLFAVIGIQFGPGDGSTTFNVPNKQRRTSIGAGGTSISGPANTIGSFGGEETHQLTEPELASHSHGAPTFANGSHQHQTGFGIKNGGGEFDMLISGGTSPLYGFTTHTGTIARDTTGLSNFSGISVNDAWTNVPVNGTQTLPSDGSDSAHNNMPPSLVVNFMIRF